MVCMTTTLADSQTPDSLSRLCFDNRFTRELPADSHQDDRPRQVRQALYSRVSPDPVSRPRTLIVSPEMMDTLGLSREEAGSERFARVFAGNEVLPGMDPHAACYGGHQFGHWAGQLGDGRAINLGEVIGRDDRHWMLQLKGAGPTPYSRGADGRAVLRSSVREFLCSEAMHHLGVPTTRALSLVLTGDSVIRDMFYDGNPRSEPGAVVCRVAPSFTRFGHIQMLAARNETELLRRFLDFTIETDFPHLLNSDDGNVSDMTRYLRWFDEVCELTIDMVVHWMRVGFVHGVMNTDNMSVLGLTIDYGPYGWIDDYNPEWTPNTTDAGQGRYRFGLQPIIAGWNLVQLANAIAPVVGAAEPLEEILSRYERRYQRKWGQMMAGKLGLRRFAGDPDKALFDELDQLLQARETDMTLFFRQLAEFRPADSDCHLEDVLAEAFYGELSGEEREDYRKRLRDWEWKWRRRLLDDGDGDRERAGRMNAVNPRYVLRNYLAQQAIDRAEEGDDSELHRLLDLLRRPYEDQPGMEAYAGRRPEWARNRPGCSMLSCSS